MKKILMVLVLGASAAVAMAETVSNSIFVYVNEARSSFWRTAERPEVTVPVELPAGATTATLTVSAIGYEAVYPGLAAGDFTFTLPEATSVQSEGNYTLALAFDDGQAITSTVALVKGLAPGGTGNPRCLMPATSDFWPRAVSKAVLPVPYGATSIMIDGEVFDTGLDGAQGWFAVAGLMGGATFPVTLTVDGVDYTVMLVGGPLGMAVGFR